MTLPTPQAQTIPSNVDLQRADRVVETWLSGPGRNAVAPASRAAIELRTQIALAIADGKRDELVAEQGDGPVDLEVDDRPVASLALTRAAVLAPRELETAALHHADGDVLRICRLDAVVDWLRGLAVRAENDSSL